MKKLCCLLALTSLFQVQSLSAQQVPRKTVVEHFTNTFCSVCAGRNPGFYGNLSNFPDALHVAYYPSSPYPACPFNQMNKPEQDARTNFYGVYGGTPRLVVNGSVLPGNANYTDPAILQSGLMSDYTLRVQIRRLSSTTAEAIVIVKKVAPDAKSNLQLFAVVAEDTVQFSAQNGETIHYNKFNKSLTGTAPLVLPGLMPTGDSVTRTFTFTTGNWGPSRVTAILQDDMKGGLQAARSARIPTATNIPTLPCAVPICMYPNPIGKELYFKMLPAGYHNYRIRNTMGQEVQRGVVNDPAMPVSVTGLESGFYIITLGEGATMQRGTFVKQ